MDSGLFVVRLLLGLAMAAHGAQKLFGWFGGYGLQGTGGFMASLGFRPGVFFAAAAGLGELAGGLLVAAGLFGPAGPGLIVLVMTVAALTAHRGQGFFAATNGIELPLLYGVGALALAVTGPGALSLDALLGLGWLSSPVHGWAAVAAGTLGALANLALRRADVREAQASAA